jgi:hypothetical protein
MRTENKTTLISNTIPYVGHLSMSVMQKGASGVLSHRAKYQSSEMYLYPHNHLWRCVSPAASINTHYVRHGQAHLNCT